jgi:hypothetical protein
MPSSHPAALQPPDGAALDSEVILQREALHTEPEGVLQAHAAQLAPAPPGPQHLDHRRGRRRPDVLLPVPQVRLNHLHQLLHACGGGGGRSVM